MCLRKCGVSWSVRKLITKFVVSRLSNEEADFWLWNETPFPASMPTWDQLLKKIKEIN